VFEALLKAWEKTKGKRWLLPVLVLLWTVEGVADHWFFGSIEEALKQNGQTALALVLGHLPLLTFLIFVVIVGVLVAIERARDQRHAIHDRRRWTRAVHMVSLRSQELLAANDSSAILLVVR